MIKNVLTHIGGIGMYGVISICIFFLVFLGVLIWMLTLKKSYLKTMEKLPLDDGSIHTPAPTLKTDLHHE